MASFFSSLWQTVCWGCGGAILAAVALLVVFQEKIVYVPDIPGVGKKYPFTPSRLKMKYEDVWLRAADGTKLHSWLIKYNENNDRPTLLFFQENAGNIAHRLDSIRILMYELKCNVFMLSYRGYGSSEGSPSEKGLIMDAQASLDYLFQRDDLDKTKIIAFGRSLGGAVASKIAYLNQEKISALILENTFTSILDMAGVMFPLLKYIIGAKGFRPLNSFVRNKWTTIDIIDKIRIPILFISGSRDELVPPSHMHMLYKVARSNKTDTKLVCEFKEFRHGTHMDTWLRGGPEYWKTIRTFLTTHNDILYDHDHSDVTEDEYHDYYEEQDNDEADFDELNTSNQIYEALKQEMPNYRLNASDGVGERTTNKID